MRSGAAAQAPACDAEPIVEAEVLRREGLAPVLGAPRVVLEIGFGRGELLIDLAGQSPDRRFLGVEVSRKRVARVARRVRAAGLTNCFLVHAPAEYLLERVLPGGSVEACWICCPDPWPKKRHHKRRLVRPSLVEQLVHALAPGALLHLATDHPGYRDWIADVMASASGLENLHAPAPFSARRPERRLTAYEQEWIELGRSMAYFDYRKAT